MAGGLPEAERLAGRVALVTGAAGGTGAATARRFAAEGASCWPAATRRWPRGISRNPDCRRAMLAPMPLRRAGQPEEVAAMIAVEGGWLLARNPPPGND